MSKEALKLALEALEWCHGGEPCGTAEAITAIKAALAQQADHSEQHLDMVKAQPAQQDSTCSNALRAQGKAYPRTCKKCGLGPCVGLAQPSQRTWVGLDEKDFSAINQSCLTKLQAATSAESILKEKNNGLL